MVERFQNKFNIIKDKLIRISFLVEKEDDYGATFGDGSSWKIDFSGDRYSDVYWIRLRKIDINDIEICRIGFSIDYLMKIFDNKLENQSINDELDFIIEYKDKIFDETFPYKKKYDELNSI